MKVYAIGILSNQPRDTPLVWVDDFPKWFHPDQIKAELVQYITSAEDDPKQSDSKQSEPKQSDLKQSDLKQSDLKQSEPTEVEQKQSRTRDGFKFFIHSFYQGYAVAITDASFADLSGQVLTQMLAAKYTAELLTPSELTDSWTVFLKAPLSPRDQINSELAQVRQIMTQDVELLLQRQGNVEFLLEQTEQLVSESSPLLPKPFLVRTNQRCCSLL
ncbi:MAG TPA: hypothetical protein VJ044_08210 [Candidatus Hodarchaeales archaeon]|nr:hypothetical protein [Candidatus Hodarchaeales archaeon]